LCSHVNSTKAAHTILYRFFYYLPFVAIAVCVSSDGNFTGRLNMIKTGLAMLPIGIPLVLEIIILCLVMSTCSAYPQPMFATTFPLPAQVKNDGKFNIAVSPPVVLRSGAALVAYYDYFSTPLRSALAAYDVRHSAPPPQGGPSTGPSAGVEVFAVTGSFVSLVTALSDNTAVAVVTQMDDPSASGAAVVGMMDISTADAASVNVVTTWSVDRLNSTDRDVLVTPSRDSVIFFADLPSVSPSAPPRVELVKLGNLSQPHGGGVVLWNYSWTAPVSPSRGAPLFYDGNLYFFHTDILYRIDASGHPTSAFQDPCGVSSVTSEWNLAMPTYDETTAGSSGGRDAFIVYGNTSSSSTTTVCRFSHNTGKTEWSQVLPGTFVIDDVYGGGGNIYLTGHTIDPTLGTVLGYSTHVLNATTGNLVAFPYVRTAQDARSFPRLLPSYMNAASGCVEGPAMVQQASGKTYAYCAAVPYAILWSNNVPCYHAPLVVSPIQQQPDLTFIGCTDYQAWVSLLRADSGELVWSYSFDVSQPLTTDGAFVYAVNMHGQLTQLSLAAGSGGQPQGGDSSGLTESEKALVSVVVIASVAALVVAVLRARGYLGGCSSHQQRRRAHDTSLADADAMAGERIGAVNRESQQYGGLAA
jgi:hypothetical protein